MNKVGVMPFPYPNPEHLEPLFRHEVLKLLKKGEKITGAVIENMIQLVMIQPVMNHSVM